MCYSVDMEETTEKTTNGASLYTGDVLKLEQFIMNARSYAWFAGEEVSIRVEVDSDAWVTLSAAGVEPITL